MPPELDDRDRAWIAHAMQDYNALPGPRVGDFFIHANGVVDRFTHKWENGLQTVDATRGVAEHAYYSGFYLGRAWGRDDGQPYISYSGGLDPTVPNKLIVLTNQTRSGSIWTFHHQHWTANNGVHTNVEFRVYTHKGQRP